MEPSRSIQPEGSAVSNERTQLRSAGKFEVPSSPPSTASTPATPNSKPVSIRNDPFASPYSSISSSKPVGTPEVKKDPIAAALEFEAQVKRYFVQLTVGCGNTTCANRFCRSSSAAPKLQEAEAAIWAANLAAGPRAHLCEQIEEVVELSSTPSALIGDDLALSGSPVESTFSQHMTRSLLSPFSNKPKVAGLEILTKKKKDSPKHSYVLSRFGPKLDLPDDEFETSNVVLELNAFLSLVEKAEQTGDYTAVLSQIKQVFSSPDALNQSFLRQQHAKIDLRNSSGSRLEEQAGLQMGFIDLDAVQLVYSTITDRDDLKSAFVGALELLFLELQALAQQVADPRQLRVYVILFSSPLLGQTNLPNYTYIIKRFLKSFIMLSPNSVRYILFMISKWSVERIQQLVDALQVCINAHVRSEPHQQQETLVLYACEVLKQLSYMNDERKLFPFAAFYNSFLNMKLNMKERFKAWKMAKDNGDKTKLDVFDYPLLLDPVAKSRIFHIESFLAMSGELEDTYVVALFRETFADIAKNSPTSTNVIPPSHLILKVRREHLLEDTIEQIVSKVKYIRKPLKVSFVGEEGVDYSGVQKEFFQLLVECVFATELGLWKHDDGQRFFWFSNKKSPDARRLFKFAGILFGLAIYNGIILDVHFPLVLYKKLLGKKPNLGDLHDFNPAMGKGLQQLLTFEGDVESTYCYAFQASVTKSDSSVVMVDLKPGGADIPVNNSNRKEYVELYIDWLFNRSVQEQFEPFLRGFQLVCDGYAPRMCRPEELEQLVCGSRELNFDELKEDTEYVGFTDTSPQIRWFWQIALSMNEEEKKKLLQFVTGSDRAPIEGLRSLPFRIQRNGPDSDRLPTSHTCFSVLMLPEYSSRDKLKKQLLTAIQNSQGFGLM